MNTSILAISGISIKQDSHGRFCLNDLHKAAGGEKRHQPSRWLIIQQTIELINELKSTPRIQGVEQNQPVDVINGGVNRGTYADKELVYAYATWISARFFLTVIRAYDSLVSPKPYGLRELPTINKTQVGEICCRVDEIVLASEDSGKVKPAIWSRFKNHFRINGYKELPAEKYDDAITYIEKLREEYANGVKMILIPESELEALRLPNPKARFQDHPQSGDTVTYIAELDDEKQFAMIPLEKWRALEGELLAPSVEQAIRKDEILKHVEYNDARINAFEDLLNGMKRSNEVFKGVLKA